MPAARYWRVVGLLTDGNLSLEMSELRLYAGGVLADATAALSCNTVPDSGTLALLRDDSAAAAVTWSAAKYSSPGFALVWDFGVGGAIDVSHIRIGAGGAADTFARDLTVQWSDDAVLWTRLTTVAFARFPGVNMLMPSPASGGSNDPDSDKVVLLLSGDGPDNSTTFNDTSPVSKAVTRFGNAIIKTDTGQGAFGGAHIKLLPLDFLTVPNGPGFDFSSGSWCIEARIYPLVTNGIDVILSVRNASSQGMTLVRYNGLLLAYSSSGGNRFGSITVPADVYSHVAFAHDGSVLRMFVNGALAFSGAFSLIWTAGLDVVIGKSQVVGNDGEAFNGFIEELRVTKGAARYIAPFTPPVAPFGSGAPFVLSDPTTKRLRTAVSAPVKYAGDEMIGYQMTLAAQAASFADVVNGGQARVFGTVKEKNTPVNTPLRRRVLLLDERSQIVIRQTWSDAVTGNYEFKGITPSATYTVMSYDHTGTYRAVIADAQLAVAL